MPNRNAEGFCRLTTLFTAGESGYFTYRIPALAVSPGGTVLAFAEARRNNGADDDDIDLVLKRSLDGGLTWQPMQVLFQDGTHSVNQPTPIVDGVRETVVLVFCRDNKQVFVTESSDDGILWAPPVEITSSVVDPQWAFVGAGPGHGIQLTSGRLLVPSWGDVSPGPLIGRQEVGQFSYTAFSDDHGATWRRGVPMDMDCSDECMAVETVDGSVYMDMRSRQEKKCRAYAWSRDGGATWSEVRYNPQLPEPSCQGSIIRYGTEKDGGENRVIMAHPAATGTRERLTVLMSTDECRSWPIARVLDQGYSGYSDLAVTPDRTVLCLYEADGCRTLTLARFDLAWLTG